MRYREDQIDAYLRGEMTPSESAAFEADMENDSTLAREVNMIRLIVTGLKDRQEKMETMAGWQREVDEKQITQVVAKPSRPWVPWLTAFTAAAAVVVGVFLFHPISSPLLHPDMTTTKPVMRGSDFSRIDSLIKQGCYQEALNAVQTEIAETDSLLKESIRKREEAEYDVQKYEYALKLLQEKLDEIRANQESD